MKKIFPCIFILIVFSFFEIKAVTVTGTAGVSAGPSTSILNTMVVESGASNGSTTSDPYVIYVPIWNDVATACTTDTGTCSQNFYKYGNSNLPKIEGTTANDPYLTDGVIRTVITIDNDSFSETYNFYVGVLNNNDNTKMSIISGNQITNSSPLSSTGIVGAVGTNSEETFTTDIYLNNLCHTSSTNGFSCALINDVSVTESEVTVTLVYFVSTTSYNRFVDSVAVPAEAVFYKVRLSNQVATLSTFDVSLGELTKGDGRVKAVYSGPEISEFHEVIAVKQTSSNSSRTPIQDSFTNNGGTIVGDPKGAESSGQIIIKNLENDAAVTLSIGFANKWGFVTKLSPSLTQTPESIETFLEKQSCYLLSAGFQEEHYVLDYFRGFRDRVLLNNSWGKKFVEFYYGTAPALTPYIYKSKIISSFVRGVGHVLYFIFTQYLIAFSALLALGLVLFKYRLRPKKAFQKF